MSDLISRSALIKRLEEWNRNDDMDKALYNFAMNRVLEQPTVEAKSVIHCKDCEHWGAFEVAGATDKVKVCEVGGYMVGENGFCCYADMRKKVE